MRMEVGFPPETNKGNPSDVSLQTDCNISAGAWHCQQITTEIKNKHSQADVQKPFASTIQRYPLMKGIQDVSSHLPKSMHF
jgi:hypothetical protein